MIRARALLWSGLLLLSTVQPVLAQECPAKRLLELRYTPTARAQVAIWVETPDGTFVDTLALTEAVALRGIGNRPGAQQMVSAYRYPFGRRESVLPIWAHRRASAPGASLFRRVIFQNRAEGRASRTTVDSTRDDYFCLSFQYDTDEEARDSLDAVTCPSIFNSDKGRYITDADIANGYYEPFETGGTTLHRALDAYSLYPPRRDLTTFYSIDRPDVAQYRSDALAVMPNLDAVTTATPSENSPQALLFTVPSAWSDGDYVVFIEANVEGDYNAYFDDTTYPGPSDPDAWDSWAIDYGYPYIGQPSVVYQVPITLGESILTAMTATPSGYGSVYGDTEQLSPMDGKITLDPAGAPGSGADRLRLQPNGSRFTVRSFPTNLCADPVANPVCVQSCGSDQDCPDHYRCGATGACEGLCDDCHLVPAVPLQVAVEPHPNSKESHHYAVLRFVVPSSTRGVDRYELRVSRSPIVTDEDFERAEIAKQATIAAEALEIPTDAVAGTEVTVDFGGLSPQTHYYVAMRAVDPCNYASGFVTGEVETTEIHFTTVTPCFVATAAYGSPLADEVGVLRRFRDRHLLTHPLGRVLVDAYYRIGPVAAEGIAESDALRASARAVLTPLVALVRPLVGETSESP